MAAKSPLTVSLTPELQAFISKKVSSGRYGSASEVVREALRLLERSDQSRAEGKKAKESADAR